MTNPFHGFLLIHKCVGESSYDVIRAIKRCIPEKKIGHAGTLDPFAEGLLIVAVGKPYTKQISTFQNMTKTYTFTISLGQKTDTLDSTGTIIETAEIPTITNTNITNVLNLFLGEQEQIPPQYSAKKINGTPAYKLARQGKDIELKPQKIHISSLKLNDLSQTDKNCFINLTATVSKGTYIRTLSSDIADKLGTVGHTITLNRTSIGAFDTTEALVSSDISLDTIQSKIKTNL